MLLADQFHYPMIRKLQHNYFQKSTPLPRKRGPVFGQEILTLFQEYYYHFLHPHKFLRSLEIFEQMLRWKLNLTLLHITKELC